MAGESKQLLALYDLSREIVGISSMEEVCQKILDKTVSMLKVSRASIMKLDAQEGVLRIVAAKGLPKDIISSSLVKVGEGISGSVFKTGKPVLIKDIRASGFTARKRYKTKSLMSAPVTCFPLHVGGTPIGVINVTDRKDGRSFAEDDLKLLNTIANQTAAYLHLCNLAEESKRTEYVRREIELARSIQQKLLPKRLPKVAGFDIAGRCITAESVGGDYYDVLTGGIRPPSVVIADVAGHSVSAAMMMSAFRSALKSENSTALFSPSLAVERLNTLLYDDLSMAEQFISMIFLQLSGNVCKYTTAGHHPPLIFQHGGFINHSTEDSLLGVDRFAEYHEKKVELQKGDIIVMYTDGLIEAVKSTGRHFDVKEIRHFIKANKASSAEEMVGGLCRQAIDPCKGRALRDDVTIVVIKAE